MALALFLTWRGFFTRPGLGAWPMFTYVCTCELAAIDIAKAHYRSPFDQWEYLTHGDPGMGPDGLATFLRYLRSVHGVVLEGYAVIEDTMGGRELRRISDGRLVD